MFPSPFGHSFVVTTFFALNLFLSEDLCLKHTNIVFKLHWSLFVFCLTRFISNTMRGDHSFFYVYFNFCLWDLCHTWSISYSISFFHDLFCLTIVLYWFCYKCQDFFIKKDIFLMQVLNCISFNFCEICSKWRINYLCF